MPDPRRDPVSLGPSDSVHLVVEVAAFGGVEPEGRPAGQVAAERLVALPSLYPPTPSKNPDGPKLIFTPDEWDAFISGAKDGELDLS